MPALIEDRRKAGRFLYRLAWCVEIGAASIGLALAWYFLYIQLDLSRSPDGSLSTNDLLLAFVAAIPFVMVAVVELTKIPFAYACYLSTSRMARYVFTSALFILSIITFETFSNGFQQYIQVQLQAVRKLHMSMQKINNEKKNLERDQDALSGLTREGIIDTHTNRVIEIEKAANKRKREIREMMDRDSARLGGPIAKQLQTEIAQLQVEAKEDEQHFQSERKKIESGYGEKVKTASADIASLKSDLRVEISNRNKAVDRILSKIDKKENEIRAEEGEGKAGGEGEEKIRVKYESRISTINESIRSLLSNIDKKENEIRSKEGGSSLDSEGIKRIKERFKDRRSRVKEATEDQKKSLREGITLLQSQLKDLENQKDQETFLVFNYTAEEVQKRITQKQSELDENTRKLSEMSIETQINKLNEDEKNEIKIELVRSDAERKSITKRLQSEITLVKNEIDNLRKEVNRLDGEEERDILAERNRSKTEQGSIIQRLQNEINQSKVEVGNLRSQIQRFEQELRVATLGEQRKSLSDNKNVELRTLDTRQAEARRKRSELITKKMDERRKILESYEEELIPKEKANDLKLKNIRENAAEQIKEAEAVRKKDTAEFERRDVKLAGIRDRISALNKEHSADDANLTKEALKTPVGQWAISLFGSATPKNIQLVSWVWFGSIAAITAWTGTLLAFASLVLHYGSEERHRPKRGGRSVKHLLIKYLRKPRIKVIEKEVEKIVEVIKEVPVTKVVTQEVPKEVIRKEVIHVPIASDDLTILDIKKKKRPKKKPKDDEDKESED